MLDHYFLFFFKKAINYFIILDFYEMVTSFKTAPPECECFRRGWKLSRQFRVIPQMMTAYYRILPATSFHGPANFIVTDANLTYPYKKQQLNCELKKTLVTTHLLGKLIN